MNEQIREIVVPDNKGKVRLDVFLASKLAGSSRSQIQKLIKGGHITVNGSSVKSNYIIRPSETIRIVLPKPSFPDITPENIPLDIRYEDDDLLIINKPAGMVVHPAHGHRTGTLVHALLGHCNNLSSMNEPYRPGIVHRLDMDTSGLLVAAKNDYVHRELAFQFKEKTVFRRYIAFVWHSPKKKKGTIETKLDRSTRDRKIFTVAQTGKRAVTHYEVIEQFPLLTMLYMRLETGRTHQIRVHLKYLGHPVFGDQTYGGRTRQLGGLSQRDTAFAIELLEIMPRQALHAQTLGFIHPNSGEELYFEAELPEDMRRLEEKLKEASKI